MQDVRAGYAPTQPRIQKQTMKKFFGLIVVLQILIVLASITIARAVVYVAWHFISKVW